MSCNYLNVLLFHIVGMYGHNKYYSVEQKLLDSPRKWECKYMCMRAHIVNFKHSKGEYLMGSFTELHRII